MRGWMLVQVKVQPISDDEQESTETPVQPNEMRCLENAQTEVSSREYEHPLPRTIAEVLPLKSASRGHSPGCTVV